MTTDSLLLYTAAQYRSEAAFADPEDRPHFLAVAEHCDALAAERMTTS